MSQKESTNNSNESISNIKDFFIGYFKDFFKDKKKLIFSIVYSFLMALSLVVGYRMRAFDMTEPGNIGKLMMVLKSLPIALIFLPGFSLIFYFAKARDLFPKKAKYKTSVKPAGVQKPNKNGNSSNIDNNQNISGSEGSVIKFPELKKSFNPIALFFITWAVIFAAWFPVFLAYYPAIMSYDSNRQFYEGYNGIFWQLQPIIHTFLIRTFVLWGEKIGSYEKGMATYSIIQMATLSLALSYLITFTYKLSKNKIIYFITVAFLAIVPFNGVFSLIVTKDVFFCSFFIILFTACLERSLLDVDKKIIYDIIMIVCAALMMMFRKNGVYGFALFVIPFVLGVKKEKVRILIVSILCIAVGMLSLFGLKKALNASDGPKKEMFSVTIQQFAHITAYHKGTLPSDDAEILDKYLPGLVEEPNYHPYLADGPKYNASEDAFDDTVTLLKDWVKLGIKYPGDYLDAYIGLTLGYFFLDDTSLSQYLGYGRDNMRGLIETFNASPSIDGSFVGVTSVSKLPWLQYAIETFISDEAYQGVPVLSLIFHPSFYLWIVFTCIGVMIYKKRYRELAISSLQITYFLTVILGPVANLRYVYQLIVAVPVFIVLAFRRK